jgi:hypothetical protein
VARTPGAGRGRRAGVVELPPLPDVPRLPRPSIGVRGSVIKDVALQPTIDEFNGSALKAEYPMLTYPEFLTDWALSRSPKAGLFLKRGVGYLFQKAELGFSYDEYIPGSTKVDFVYVEFTPWIYLPVQGKFWHSFQSDQFQRDLDVFRRLQAMGDGIVIPLMESALVQDAAFVVRSAVKERLDLSPYKGLI